MCDESDALMTKEFLALLKDKRSRIVVFVPPILQLLVFGYAATFDLNRIPLAVYDEDHSQASRDLVARFEGSPNFAQVAVISHEEEIAPLVDARKALLVLHIGPTVQPRTARRSVRARAGDHRRTQFQHRGDPAQLREHHHRLIQRGLACAHGRRCGRRRIWKHGPGSIRIW